MGKRMTAERLEWWLKVQRDGKLGANFETLIRDFQTEREVVERVEALDIPQSLRVVAKEISDEGHNGWGNHLTSTADNLETALEQP